MQTVTMKELLECGAHFGHQRRRWNPKMKPYIFTERNGIYIFDLKQTIQQLRAACDYVRDLAADGKKIIFVGTKKQARDGIKEAAESCGMPYINNRWLGGMLTNFKTIRRSIARLIELEKLQDDPEFEKYTKKEQSMFMREKQRLAANLEGVKTLTGMPGALFVMDVHKEQIAIREANKVGIPVVAVVDTNCDPTNIDLAIPGNDDAIRSIKLFCNMMASAVRDGLHAAEIPLEPVPAEESKKTATPADSNVESPAKPAQAPEGVTPPGGNAGVTAEAVSGSGVASESAPTQS
jgi:small subunit ribosomal protein S2